MLEELNLKERRKVVLYNDGKHNYVLYQSNKSETILIQELLEEVNYGISSNIPNSIKNVILGGHVSEIRNEHIKEFIPLTHVHSVKSLIPRGMPELFNEYKCYQTNRKTNYRNNLIVHEDKLSSFKCAIEYIKSDWFIIVKEEMVKDIFVFGTGGEMTKEDFKSFEDIWKGDINGAI